MHCHQNEGICFDNTLWYGQWIVEGFGPSNQQNEFEPKACIEVVFSYKIELPLLSREPTQFVYMFMCIQSW